MSETIRPPHSKTDFFNDCLQNFQEDIRRIIGKFRYNNHHLDIDEIASRANLMLVKKRDDILYGYDGNFDINAFKKIAYVYCRNIIGWSHSKENNDKYVTQRTDNLITTDEGPKTSFEFTIETEGYEDEGFEAFDSNTKFTTLLHVIKEYCHILTDAELKILSCLEVGMTHEQISKKLNVTRQAVSHTAINLFDKIKSHFSSDFLNDDNSSKVSEGNAAINDFFTDIVEHHPITKKDKISLKRFLLANALRYNNKEVANIFENGKYNPYQILSFCNRNKLSFCLVKPPKKHKFSEEDAIKIANLYKEGKTAHEIGEIFGVRYNVISGKKGHLSRLGLLTD